MGIWSLRLEIYKINSQRIWVIENKNIPFLSLSKLFWYVVIKRIKIFSILNYLDYNKEIAMNEIKN